jgi:hypothetical protein
MRRFASSRLTVLPVSAWRSPSARKIETLHGVLNGRVIWKVSDGVEDSLFGLGLRH